MILGAIYYFLLIIILLNSYHINNIDDDYQYIEILIDTYSVR